MALGPSGSTLATQIAFDGGVATAWEEDDGTIAVRARRSDGRDMILPSLLKRTFQEWAAASFGWPECPGCHQRAVCVRSAHGMDVADQVLS